MWVPDSIQISREMLEAELNKTIPTGSTVALAAFMMSGAKKGEEAKKIVENHSIDRDAAKVAWKFLQTGQIVTSDGEILTETNVVESRATTVVPNRPTASSDSNTSVEEFQALFTSYFPNWPVPSVEQSRTVLDRQGLEFADNALFNMANGKTEVKNPIILLLWLTNNRTPDQIRQERETLEHRGVSSDSIVRKAMREAEAKIPTLPTPSTTKQDVDLLKELREKVERARN